MKKFKLHYLKAIRIKTLKQHIKTYQTHKHTRTFKKLTYVFTILFVERRTKVIQLCVK